MPLLLPDDTVRLTVEQGCNLSAGWCDGEGSATIFETYTPTGGTVSVSAALEDDVRLYAAER